MSASLRAFLAMLRQCEVGTVGDEGYRIIVGGSKFDSFADHPRVLKSGTFSNGVDWKSTAAGAYQFLASTWDAARAALGLPDFSPASQDEAAVWLIKRRGALNDVEAGRLAQAIEKCNREWASLPGSPYGQPTKTYETCEAVYRKAGGFVAQDTQADGVATPSTTPPRPQVPVPPAPEPDLRSPDERIDPRIEQQFPETPAMPIHALVTAAASALLPIVADLFRARGSKTAERNADIIEAAAPVLVEVAKAVVPGASNEQAAAEAILKSKELQEAYRAAVALKWADVAPAFEFDEGSRNKAREWMLAATTEGPTWRQIGAGVLLAILSLLVLAGGGWMLREVLQHAQTDQQTKGLIIGFLISAATMVLSYFFGSSASSRVKDQTISDQASKR